jgi:prepilin-type processing-associated H-X9-DG protein
VEHSLLKRDKKMRKNYFTIVELLVVISLIFLLFAMLLPSLRNVKGKSKETLCLSNERAIGISIQMFAGDNGGIIKPDFSKTAVYDIDYAYEQYVDNPNVFHCPSCDPEMGKLLVFNGSVLTSHYGVFSPFNYAQAYNLEKGGYSPCEVRLVGEVIPPEVGYYWISEWLCPWESSAEYRHGNGMRMNIVFGDGSGFAEREIPLPIPANPDYPPYIKIAQ